MSDITFTLRKCLSEANRLTKEFVTTQGTDKTFTGLFKEPQSLLNPVITVETTDDLSDYNYCEITAFKRKYFCNVTAVSYKLWKLTLEVDVLSTYATGIKASPAIVKRTEASGKINYYMNDGLFYTEQRQIITYHKFKKNGNDAKLGDGTYYYLLVAGG